MLAPENASAREAHALSLASGLDYLTALAIVFARLERS